MTKTKVLCAVVFAFALGSSVFADERCPTLCSTHPISPSSDCCKTMHIDVGLLYQQPVSGYMFPGTIGQVVRNETVLGVVYEADEFHDIRPCFDYAIGLTASLGRLLDHDNWYIGARFDWLSATANTKYSLNDEPGKEIHVTYPYVGASGLAGDFQGLDELDDRTYQKMLYAGRIDFYQLDVLASRGSYHTSCFAYEPIAGVKALWFHTNQKSTYYAGDVSGLYNPKQDNWGVGPLFGVNAEYYFTNSLALFSNSDVALLYGESTRDIYVECRVNTTDPDEEYQTTFYRKISCTTYVPVRTILGLKFSRYYFDDEHYLAIKVGYDARAVMSYIDTSRGIFLSGLYANLEWSF